MLRDIQSFYILTFASFFTLSSAAFCGKLGAYDALCLHSNAVFLVSVSPCHKVEFDYDAIQNQAVEITVIDTVGKLKKYDMSASEDIAKPVSFGRSDVGVMLEMHYHSDGSKIGNLHVDLSLGNFSDNGINSRESILNVNFYIEKAGPCFDSFSGASFYPSPRCRISKRTGNYSTLCISKPSASIDKSSEGIFIISVDPCTAPMSYWVVAFFPSKNNTQVIQRYTGSKTDAFIPVENGSCGLKVKVVPKSGDTRLMGISMLYGCKDSTAVQLINDYYFPEFGEMCLASKCKYLGPFHRRCFSKMIIGNQKSVSITSEIKISECSRPHEVEVNLQMEGEPNKLYARFDNHRLNADFFFDGMNRTQPTDHHMKPVVNGYIPKFGGHLSVIVERFHDLDHGITNHHRHTEDLNLAYLIIDRRYGDSNSSEDYLFPLAFEEISLPPCKNSGVRTSFHGQPTLSGGVKAVIAISVIAIVVVIIGFIIYRRRRRNGNIGGLPYQIELHYDDEADNSFKDDL